MGVTETVNVVTTDTPKGMLIDGLRTVRVISREVM